MAYPLTAELTDLGSVVRQVLEELSPLSRVRAVAESGSMDAELWSALGKDIGVLGLGVPDRFGGEGLGVQALAAVAGELGGALAPVPFITSSCCSAQLLAVAGGEAADAWLPPLASGDACLAVDLLQTGRESTGGLDARLNGGRWRLSGTTPAIEFAANADLVMLPVEIEGTPRVLGVRPGSEGVHARSVPTLDETLPMARLELSDAPGVLVAEGDIARRAVERALMVGRICLMHEQVAIMARSLQLAVEYARIRRQFGAPIGSFQAVQFLCADMHLHWDEADAASSYVAWAADQPEGGLDASLLVAAVACSEGARAVTGSLIQVLGGIGFTWEHDAHLYFKRAHACLHRLGAPDSHRRNLQSLWGLS